MWHNYIITAWRVLTRNRLFTFINVIGLAIGLAACILVLLFVRDELAFDQNWPNAERIFRIQTHFEIPGIPPLTSVATAGPVKDVLSRNIDEIELAARFNQLRPTIREGERVFVEEIAFIDPAFLAIFSIEALTGNLSADNADATSIIVTESFAAKYFGADDPLGRVLTLTIFDSVRDYQVAAVVSDPPINSHLTYNAFVYVDESEFTGQPWMFESWLSVNHMTYVRLKDGAGISALTNRLDKLVDDNFTEWPTGPDLVPSDLIELSAMNVRDIHIKAQGTRALKPSGDMRIIYSFSAIATLILLIACINFMNLSTVKSTQRAKEVAVRKIMGARRAQLALQFLAESVFLSLVGLVLALAVAEAALPWFNSFTNRTLELGLTSDLSTVILYLGLALFVGIAGGAYPALHLSRFLPAATLSGGKSGDTGQPARLRQVLVVFQFTISIGLLVVTAVVYSQMNFLRSTDLGFDRERLLLVRNLERDAARPYADTLKAEISAIPGVISASLSNSAPASDFEYTAPVRIRGRGELTPPMIGYRLVDEDFFGTYGIAILAGRDFDEGRPADRLPADLKALPPDRRTGTVVLNASAVRRLDLGDPNSAIGSTIFSSIGNAGEAPQTVSLTIIGVVPDVHFSSLKQDIAPQMYVLNDEGYRVLAVRLDDQASPPAVLRQIGQSWRRVVSDVPFDYEYLDDVLARQYEQEAQQATILATFATLAAIVAALGLFGLAAFTAQRRTLEIGIRKIMGASVFDITRLLVLQFSSPVIIANLIAWPVALYVLQDWLSIFAYRIDLWTIGPAACALAAAISLLMAWMTVGGHARLVARANPVHALRAATE